MKQSEAPNIDIDATYYAAQVLDLTYNEENFFMNVTSGRRGRVYVLTPKHAKRLLMLLEKYLEEYERRYGELRTKLPKNKTATSSEKTSIGFSVR